MPPTQNVIDASTKGSGMKLPGTTRANEALA